MQLPFKYLFYKASKFCLFIMLHIMYCLTHSMSEFIIFIAFIDYGRVDFKKRLNMTNSARKCRDMKMYYVNMYKCKNNVIFIVFQNRHYSLLYFINWLEFTMQNLFCPISECMINSFVNIYYLVHAYQLFCIYFITVNKIKLSIHPYIHLGL